MISIKRPARAPYLRNEELGPFSEDEDKVLHNQSQEEDDDEEVKRISPITTVPPCYIPPHTKSFEESNFQDFEYDFSLNHEEVQHPVGNLFEWMCFLTKQDIQHTLQQYHVRKEANYKTQLSNPTKLINICDDDSCAWWYVASFILSST